MVSMVAVLSVSLVDDDDVVVVSKCRGVLFSEKEKAGGVVGTG